MELVVLGGWMMDRDGMLMMDYSGWGMIRKVGAEGLD
jgi:hypothetical protein